MTPSSATAASPPGDDLPGRGLQLTRTRTGRAVERERDRPPLRSSARRLVVAVDVAAVAVLVMAAVQAAGYPVSPIRVLVAALLLAAGESTLATVRLGGAGESYSLMEATLILALPVVPWPWLTIAALGSVVSQAASGRSYVKIGYNLATTVVGVAAGGAVAHLVAGGPPDVPAGRAVLALVLGALTFWLWSTLAVGAVLAAASGEPFWRVFTQGRGLRFVVGGVNIALALWAESVAANDPLALAILPVVLGLLLWAYRGYVRATHDRDLWRQLEQAAKELNRLDEHQVLQSAAGQALSLFRADAAEVVLRGRRADDRPKVHRSHRVANLPHEWYAVPQRFAGDIEVSAVGRHDATFLAVPLPDVGGLAGQLRLCFVGHVRPEPRELQLLRTFAHTVATSLLTAELYQEVADLARRKSHEADHDPLTGLANRALLIRRVDQAIGAVRSGRTVAVALFDLDHFKNVNDTLGHAAGDALLMSVANRLPDLVRSRDTVARLGGDEFALLLTDLTSPEQAERVVADVMRAVSEPVTVAGVDLSVQASAGIACYPVDADDVHGLLQRADTAMYAAKRQRGSYRRYDGSGDVDAGLRRLALGAELHRALAQGEFDVHYQPQIELATGDVVGFEALVRWRHPERGLLPPGEFISIVEQSGFVGEFTLAVLDQALAACTGWPSTHGRPITVAVNLSARNLLDRTFCDEVAARLARHGVAAERLVLEITETTVLSELEVVERVLGSLRAHGVQLSVDDFGTGYSSLTFLQRVKVNELKIDRTFVASVLDSPQAAALVRATIELARSLGLRTVAEGVESQEVVQVLAALGCDVVQGFQFAAAVPASEVCQVVRSLAVH